MSLATEGPRAVPRGPTGMSSSVAPPVPSRSFEPAQPVDAHSASRVSRPSAPAIRRLIRPSPILFSRPAIVLALSVSVETFLLDEDHHATHRFARTRGLHVVDVHAAPHRQTVPGLDVPLEDGGGGVVLLQRLHELARQV